MRWMMRWMRWMRCVDEMYNEMDAMDESPHCANKVMFLMHSVALCAIVCHWPMVRRME